MAKQEVKWNWADEENDADNEVEELSPVMVHHPPPTETVNGNIKTVARYEYDDDCRLVKVVTTFRLERRFVSKTVARRKMWAKFGACKGDPQGPNPATTIATEEVYMHFLSVKEEETRPEEGEGLEKMRGLVEKGVVRCRKCGGDHWTTKCPYKDTVLPLVEEKKPEEEKMRAQNTKYVPPSLRDGGGKRDGMSLKNRDDMAAIRVSNLSESTTEADMEDLVKPFGPLHKIFLATDKITGECKGFAYINFKARADAAKAISALNGHGYDHLILSVDWSKPQV